LSKYGPAKATTKEPSQEDPPQAKGMTGLPTQALTKALSREPAPRLCDRGLGAWELTIMTHRACAKPCKRKEMTPLTRSRPDREPGGNKTLCKTYREEQDRRHIAFEDLKGPRSTEDPRKFRKIK